MSGEPENETKAAETASSVEPELTEEERQLQEDYRRFGIEGEDEDSMDSIADVLSTFQDDAEEEGEKKPEKANKRSDISKKQRLIPILRSSV